MEQFPSAGSKIPDTRHDGRGWKEFRNLLLRDNAVSTSPASASVRLGNTFVLAGVSTALEAPDRDSPETGTIHIQVDISALASPTRHRLQTHEAAASLSHVLNLHFQSPVVLDTHSLCVLWGRYCWNIQVDVCVLNDDGGLLDACMAATTGALKSLQLPDMQVDPDTDKLIHHSIGGIDQFVPLQLLAAPLSVTYGVSADQLLFDPSEQEEARLTSSIQVTVIGNGTCSGIELTCNSQRCQELVKEAVRHANGRYKMIEPLLPR